MKVFAIDPGTTKSGWVLFEDGAVLDAGVFDNADLREVIGSGCYGADTLAIEMIASYGMAVGASVFRTCWWIGRFADRWLERTGNLPMEVFRQDVKLHVCKSTKARDTNVRVALVDLIGPKGTKANPGPTYRVSSHAWQALGVAVTAIHKLQNPSA